MDDKYKVFLLPMVKIESTEEEFFLKDIETILSTMELNVINVDDNESLIALMIVLAIDSIKDNRSNNN